MESFTAEWVPQETTTKECDSKVPFKGTPKRAWGKWNVIEDLFLLPESITTIMVVAKGAPYNRVSISKAYP